MHGAISRSWAELQPTEVVNVISGKRSFEWTISVGRSVFEEINILLLQKDNRPSQLDLTKREMGFGGKLFTKSNVLRSLQGWICVVGIMALGNTISCFLDHSFLGKRLYTGSAEKINDLVARLFGMWTLVSALLRIGCAFYITVKPLYHLTFISFVLAFAHFTSEVLVFKTATLTIGVLTPLIISSVSMVGMLIGYWCMYKTEETKENDNLPKRVEDIQISRKMRANRHSKHDWISLSSGPASGIGRWERIFLRLPVLEQITVKNTNFFLIIKDNYYIKLK